MDYKKKYEEALDRAKKILEFYKHPAYTEVYAYAKEDLPGIFPELKDSEDEMTRKEIIDFVVSNTFFKDGRREKYLSWLEKQVSPDMIADAYLKGCDDTEKKWLEEQGEQKPINNIEPKFKVGNWIVRGDNVFKIRCIDNEYYYIETDGGYVQAMRIFEIDSFYHHWTIQDAKDGDVLAWRDSKCILLFKSIHDKVSFSVHGFISHFTGKFKPWYFYYDLNGAHPATKEQRDTLFTKMKEAGYEWDADKKELSKLEIK